MPFWRLWMPLSDPYHGLNSDWVEALRPYGVLPDLERLLARVDAARVDGLAIAPGAGHLLRALNTTALADVRVVILGQDPYPTPGHADGLCFSVRQGVAIPRSLNNIFAEMATDLDVSGPAHGSLVSWAEQGVLLLNTVLTVTEGEAGSHVGWGWQTFTDAVIAAVSDQASAAVFILWGRQAQAKTGLIDTDRHLVLASAHPSPLSARRGFFGSKPFSRANGWLRDRGQSPINWQLPPG